jgi:hypothetical protein
MILEVLIMPNKCQVYTPSLSKHFMIILSYESFGLMQCHIPHMTCCWLAQVKATDNKIS